MKESVSAVFATDKKLYFIKRQNYLNVFPGYYATPGGKIDEEDPKWELANPLWPSHLKPQILHALIREVKEELNYDIEEGIKSGEVLAIHDIGVAITPEFNPYRFKNYYIKITLDKTIAFTVDKNEAQFGEWSTPEDLLKRYHQGGILAVPPAIILLKTFVQNPKHTAPIEMSLPYDPEVEVPMIESLYGVRQFLPLSNTFPPANRTNSFIIGDTDAVKYLVDPSPKDEVELKKYINTIKKIGFEKIFLTHHHPDHYQYSREIALLFKTEIEMSEYTFKRIGEKYFNGIQVNFRKEGDTLTKSLGKEIRVYEVPGHDEGQLALAPEDLSWFLAGDLIQTIGTVVIGDEEGDMTKYFSSLKRVIALKPKNIIPSHGIIVGGYDKITQTLNHRIERENQIKNFLIEGLSLSEILNKIYSDLKKELLPYAMKTIKAHVKKINEGT